MGCCTTDDITSRCLWVDSGITQWNLFNIKYFNSPDNTNLKMHTSIYNLLSDDKDNNDDDGGN